MTNLFILIDFNGMYKDNDKDYIIDKFIKYGIDSEHQKVYLTNGCGTKTRVDTFYELTTGHEFYISCIDRENNKILGCFLDTEINVNSKFILCDKKRINSFYQEIIDLGMANSYEKAVREILDLDRNKSLFSRIRNK